MGFIILWENKTSDLQRLEKSFFWLTDLYLPSTQTPTVWHRNILQRMAHLLNIIKRKGVNERTEEDEDPDASDTIPDERHREEDLVSAYWQCCILCWFLSQPTLICRFLKWCSTGAHKLLHILINLFCFALTWFSQSMGAAKSCCYQEHHFFRFCWRRPPDRPHTVIRSWVCEGNEGFRRAHGRW